MCTVTIQAKSECLLVTMNRDEAKIRADELPPRIHTGSAPWMGPADGERGGTWIGVNSVGVVACILNGYHLGQDTSATVDTDKPSRGFIVPELLEKGRFLATKAWLEQDFNPAPYPSFTLLIASRDGVVKAEWDGSAGWHIGTIEMGWHFFASSLWRTEDVVTYRRSAYDQWQSQGRPFKGYLPAIHLLWQSGNETHTPLMVREFSRTRSITQAAVSPDSITLRYWLRDPGELPDPFHPTSILHSPALSGVLPVTAGTR